MNKRGRPNVFTKYGYQKTGETIDWLRSDETQRTKANDLYATMGRNEISETVSENPKMKAIESKTRIMIQLGRMSQQNGYNKESVIDVAMIAAELYHLGYTVQEVEKYIRTVRRTGQLYSGIPQSILEYLLETNIIQN